MLCCVSGSPGFNSKLLPAQLHLSLALFMTLPASVSLISWRGLAVAAPAAPWEQ